MTAAALADDFISPPKAEADNRRNLSHRNTSLMQLPDHVVSFCSSVLQVSCPPMSDSSCGHQQHVSELIRGYIEELNRYLPGQFALILCLAWQRR